MSQASDSQILHENKEEQASMVDIQENEVSPASSKEVEKQDSQTATPMLDETNTSPRNEVIHAVPLSYKLPDNLAITYPAAKRGRHVEQSTSRSEVVVDSQPQEWHKNWECYPRQRKNGHIDKYYYHKELDIMCRSLKEIERFEVHGILPGQRRKSKQKSVNKDIDKGLNTGANDAGQMPEKTSESSKAQGDKEKVDDEGMQASSSKKSIENSMDKSEVDDMKTIVEKFLAESYYNLLHYFDNGKSSEDSAETPPSSAN